MRLPVRYSWIPALAGGLVLGTLFGRSIVSDLSGIVHSLESRMIALETTLHLVRSSAAPATDPATAAIKITFGSR